MYEYIYTYIYIVYILDNTALFLSLASVSFKNKSSVHETKMQFLNYLSIASYEIHWICGYGAGMVNSFIHA